MKIWCDRIFQSNIYIISSYQWKKRINPPAGSSSFSKCRNCNFFSYQIDVVRFVLQWKLIGNYKSCIIVSELWTLSKIERNRFSLFLTIMRLNLGKTIRLIGSLPRVKKRISKRVSPAVMHIIRFKTLGKTLGETFRAKKSCQESRRESLSLLL